MCSSDRRLRKNISKSAVHRLNPGDLLQKEKMTTSTILFLKEIGAKHGKSAAQVALRFLMQSDVVVIPEIYS